MLEVPWRIIKLGGSLLDLPDLPAIFRRWLASQPPAENVLVVGGGSVADAIRHADQLHHLGEERSHWLCIRAMGFTAHLMVGLLPEAEIVSSIEPADAPSADRLRILDPYPLLKAHSSATDHNPLPHCWDVTSDSIAAWLAASLDADELVLLKSTLPPAGATRAAAQAEGYVDGYFVQAAAPLSRIRWVNLRDGQFAERSL